MNWGVPVWNTPVDNGKLDAKRVLLQNTKEHLEAYIDVMKREGKSGWISVPARQLYTDCGVAISETLFGRHLRELNVPKKFAKTGTIYAIFLG